MMNEAQFLGAALVLLGTCTLLLNIFMIYVFASKRLIRTAHENCAIYRLIFNFLVCEAIQITPTIYLGVCAFLQQELLPDELRVIPSTINLCAWYQMILMLITMAVNRYVGICHFNRYASIFNSKTATIVIIASWLISGTYTIVNQFVIPCCAMITYYPIYTFIYRTPPSGQENLVTKYSLPTNQTCCVILLFCYTRILWTVHKSGREALTTTTLSVQRRRTRQNIRFAIQFVLISIFYLLMYGFYTIFPKLLPAGVQLPYSAIAFCMVANCTVNSVMYLLFNPEVRRLALQVIRGSRGTWGVRSETQNLQRSHFVSTSALRNTSRERVA